MRSKIQSRKLPRDPMRSKIYCRTSPWNLIGSWIQYLLHLAEKSSWIIDPTSGSTDMSGRNLYYGITELESGSIFPSRVGAAVGEIGRLRSTVQPSIVFLTGLPGEEVTCGPSYPAFFRPSILICPYLRLNTTYVS